MHFDFRSSIYCFVVTNIPDLLDFDSQLVERATEGQPTDLFYLDLANFTVDIVTVGYHFASQLLNKLQVIVVQLEAVHLIRVHLVILQEVSRQTQGQNVVVEYF